MKNPVLKKEMKLTVRTKKTIWGLFMFNAALALCGLFAFYIMFDSSVNTTINYSDMLMLYVMIVVLEMCLVAYIVPSVTASSIAGEREKQTLEILLTTALKPWQIIWGKLVSSISTLLLYILSGLPILAIVFSVGGVQVLDLIQVILYIFVLAIYFGSFGILFSCLFKKSMVATICTYGMVIVSTLGPFVLKWTVYVIREINLVATKSGVDVANAGNSVALGFLSPMETVISLICSQVGSGDAFQGISIPGDVTHSIWENVTPEIWFAVSVVIQLLVSVGVLCLAAKRLNPIKKVRARKKKASEALEA